MGGPYVAACVDALLLLLLVLLRMETAFWREPHTVTWAHFACDRLTATTRFPRDFGQISWRFWSEFVSDFLEILFRFIMLFETHEHPRPQTCQPNFPRWKYIYVENIFPCWKYVENIQIHKSTLTRSLTRRPADLLLRKSLSEIGELFIWLKFERLLFTTWLIDWL